MYLFLTPATPLFFFPPRLQLVALQQDPDCLSSHSADQLAFDRLLDDQADSPASPPFRRLTADHGDDALFLGVVESRLPSRSLFLVEGAVQAVPVVAMGDVADGLGRSRKGVCHFRRGH